MTERHYNLVTDPWIQVISNDNGKVETISLLELFQNAASYRQFAGDMKAQDFAIMRLALAILHTVYSRFNADDEPYDWLTVDEDTLLVDDDDEYDDYAADVLTCWRPGKMCGQKVSLRPRYQSIFFGIRTSSIYSVNHLFFR